MSSEHFFVVRDDEVELRLDQLLAKNIEELSRRRAKVLLDMGGVFVDGKRTKTAGKKLKAGQKVKAVLGGMLENIVGQAGEKTRRQMEGRLPKPEILHEDEDILVVMKPARLLTAPTPESDRNNLVSLLEHHGKLFVVHRLDMLTSGVLVLAKTPFANKVLSKQFAAHTNARLYEVVVFGLPNWETHREDMAVQGKNAVTHFCVRERGRDLSLLEARLETGRTHQIRLHCQSLGTPVIGDPLYGDGRGRAPRLGLHAKVLGFSHPRTGERVRYEVPWPADMEPWLRKQFPKTYKKNDPM